LQYSYEQRYNVTADLPKKLLAFVGQTVAIRLIQAYIQRHDIAFTVGLTMRGTLELIPRMGVATIQ